MNVYFLAKMQLNWKLQFNDPDLLSWIITVLYFIAFTLNAKYMFRMRCLKNEFTVYFVSAIILFFMGVNKQLDLHVLTVELMKSILLNYNLHQYRFILIWGFLLLTIILSVLIFKEFRKKRKIFSKVSKTLLFGIGVLFTFCLIKFILVFILKFFYNPRISFLLKVIEAFGLVIVISSFFKLLSRSKVKN